MPHAHADEDLRRASSRPTRRTKGFWGNMRAYMVSLLKAWWGEAATAENDFCFDYLPRITGSHSTYETVMAQLDGQVQGLLPDRARTRPSARPTAKMQRLGHGQPRLAGGARLLADRERHLVEGRPGDRDRGDADRGHRHRGVLLARRRAHREGRQLHQHPADAAVAPQGGRSPPGTRAAICGSCSTSAADPGEAGRLGPTRWTGRSWTSPGTTRPTGRSPSRARRRCCAEINGWDADGKPLVAPTSS